MGAASCEAHEAAEAKFGEQDRDNDGLDRPWVGAGSLFLDEALERNGCTAAADIETALFDQMLPFADIIREAEVRSLAGFAQRPCCRFWTFGRLVRMTRLSQRSD